jgi:hypothetical protein
MLDLLKEELGRLKTQRDRRGASANSNGGGRDDEPSINEVGSVSEIDEKIFSNATTNDSLANSTQSLIERDLYWWLKASSANYFNSNQKKAAKKKGKSLADALLNINTFFSLIYYSLPLNLLTTTY